MTAPSTAPITFLRSMRIAQRHLSVLRDGSSSSVTITSTRRTDDGWVIGYRVGAGDECHFVVDARDGDARDLPPRKTHATALQTRLDLRPAGNHQAGGR